MEHRLSHEVISDKLLKDSEPLSLNCNDISSTYFYKLFQNLDLSVCWLSMTAVDLI